VNLQPWILDAWIYYAFRAWGYTPANAEWIVAQSRLETGNYTSKAFREDKNLWGMSCVRQRETTQIGCRNLPDGNTLGQYRTYWDSIKDRRLWDTERAGLNGTELNYQSRLDAKWGVPGYLPAVDRLIDKVELSTGRKYLMGGAVVVVAVAYFVLRAKK
jgi:hypothetical protein